MTRMLLLSLFLFSLGGEGFLFSWQWPTVDGVDRTPWLPISLDGGFEQASVPIPGNSFELIEEGRLFFRSETALYGEVRKGMLPEVGDWMVMEQPGNFASGYSINEGLFHFSRDSASETTAQSIHTVGGDSSAAPVRLTIFDFIKHRIINPQAVLPLSSESQGLGIRSVVVGSEALDNGILRLQHWQRNQVPSGPVRLQIIFTIGTVGLRDAAVFLGEDPAAHITFDFIAENGNGYLDYVRPGDSDFTMSRIGNESNTYQIETEIFISYEPVVISLFLSDYAGRTVRLSYSIQGI